MRSQTLLIAALTLLVVACSPAAPSPQAWAPVPEDGIEELPPIARLVSAEGSVVPATLGSFAYRETYGDSPWLGASGLPTVTSSSGRRLTVGLLPGNQFSAWSARYADAADTTGEVILPLSAGKGDGLERAAFDTPPSGDWVLQVNLTFPNDDGSATYFWHLVVQ